MAMTNTQIPKLRFPEFSDLWHFEALSEKVKSIKSGRTKHNASGKFPVYGSTGQIGYTDKIEFSGDNLLVARVGANAGQLNRASGNYGVTDNTLVVTPDKTVSLGFLEANLCLFNLNRLVYGSGQPLVTGTMLKRLVRAFPSLSEQKKIADFLASVDTKISQLERKKELLNDYKSGCMQQLFSQEARFKSDNGHDFPDWEEKRLGAVGKIFGGLTGKSADDFGSGARFVTYLQVFKASQIYPEQCGFVEISAGERQNKIQRGDIIFTTSSETPKEVGFASVVTEEMRDTYLNSFCFALRPNDIDALVPEFSRYLFRSEGYRNKVVPLAQGSTRYNLSKASFLKLKLHLPHPDEQRKIADFLSAIDRKIELVAIELEKAKAFKKGLLQQMFV